MFLSAAHCLFLVAIAGTALVTGSLGVGLVLMGLYGVGLLVAVWRRHPISNTVEAILSLLMLPISFMYAMAKGDEILISFQYFMALMLAVRAWKVLKQRDYFFNLCMAAGIFTQIGKVYADLPFLMLTVFNVALLPHALHGIFVRFHVESVKGVPVVRARNVWRTQTLALAGVSCWLGLVLALIFLVLPRNNAAMSLASQKLQARMTGFADNISLGTFGRIQQNHQIAMRVRTQHPGMWRGGVLEVYQKGTWQGSATQYQWRKPGERGAVHAGVPTHKHHIHILKISEVNFRLFSKGDVVDVNQIHAPGILWINDLNAGLGARQDDLRKLGDVEYDIDTQEGEYFGLPELAENRQASLQAVYLQVPADVSPAVRNLAASVTQGLSNEVDKVAAIERFLRAEYTYSLDDLNSGTRPPLDYFLFDSKKGHCEYFATAMAMMLRCAGVPTRVVEGFAPGVLVDGEYVIRMSDAHVWVDVFYPGHGWKSHDPTPVTDAAMAGEETLSAWFDRLQIQWMTHVMDYEGLTQAGLFSWLARVAEWPIQILSELSASGIAKRKLWIEIFVLFGLAGWLAFRWRTLRARGGLRSRTERLTSGMPDWFRRYLRWLAKQGYERAPGSTASELLVRLSADRIPVLLEARYLTDLYLRTRYRSDVPSSEDLAKARAALAAIRRWKRQE